MKVYDVHLTFAMLMTEQPLVVLLNQKLAKRPCNYNCFRDFELVKCVDMEGCLSKKSIHINGSFVHAIALALW